MFGLKITANTRYVLLVADIILSLTFKATGKLRENDIYWILYIYYIIRGPSYDIVYTP